MLTRRERGWIGFTWDLLSFSTESDQDPQNVPTFGVIYQVSVLAKQEVPDHFPMVPGEHVE